MVLPKKWVNLENMKDKNYKVMRSQFSVIKYIYSCSEN